MTSDNVLLQYYTKQYGIKSEFQLFIRQKLDRNIQHILRYQPDALRAFCPHCFYPAISNMAEKNTSSTRSRNSNGVQRNISVIINYNPYDVPNPYAALFNSTTTSVNLPKRTKNIIKHQQRGLFFREEPLKHRPC